MIAHDHILNIIFCESINYQLLILFVIYLLDQKLNLLRNQSSKDAKRNLNKFFQKYNHIIRSTIMIRIKMGLFSLK